jgi:hypothetical protein
MGAVTGAAGSAGLGASYGSLALGSSLGGGAGGGSSSVALAQAYQTRMSALSSLASSLLGRRDALAHQLARVQARRHEVSAARQAIEGETLADAEAVLHRLRVAEGGKHQQLQADADTLQTDIAAIDAFYSGLLRFQQPAASNSLSTVTGLPLPLGDTSAGMGGGMGSEGGALYDPAVALDFMRAYPELCAEADRLSAKGLKAELAVRADDLPREVAARLETLQQHDALADLVAAKDRIILQLLRDRDRASETGAVASRALTGAEQEADQLKLSLAAARSEGRAQEATTRELRALLLESEREVQEWKRRARAEAERRAARGRILSMGGAGAGDAESEYGEAEDEAGAGAAGARGRKRASSSGSSKRTAQRGVGLDEGGLIPAELDHWVRLTERLTDELQDTAGALERLQAVTGISLADLPALERQQQHQQQAGHHRGMGRQGVAASRNGADGVQAHAQQRTHLTGYGHGQQPGPLRAALDAAAMASVTPADRRPPVALSPPPPPPPRYVSAPSVPVSAPQSVPVSLATSARSSRRSSLLPAQGVAEDLRSAPAVQAMPINTNMNGLSSGRATPSPAPLPQQQEVPTEQPQTEMEKQSTAVEVENINVASPESTQTTLQQSEPTNALNTVF